MRHCVYFFLFVLLVGYTRKPGNKDLAIIKTMVWTWVSGQNEGHFGDFIEFEDDLYELKKDSIFRKSIFKGRIARYNSKYREITIETTDKKKLIYYNHNFK